MSVSTVSQPGYNKFYDDESLSSGGSQDSFVHRKGRDSPRRAGHEGGGVKQGHAHTGVLSSLLAPFYNCCSPNAEQPLLPANGSQRGSERGGAPPTSLTSSSSASGATFDKIPLGAAPHLKGKGHQQNNLPESERTAAWRIAHPLNTDMIPLSPEQKQYAGLTFCLRMEGSSHMNTRLISSCLQLASDESETVSILNSLKKPEFEQLELLRVIEARTVAEVLGDLISAVETLEGNGGVYSIVSKVRTCAMHARRQGEAMVLSVFDPSPTATRGAAIFGFKQLADLEEFVNGLFGRDPEVRRAPPSERYKSILLTSAVTYKSGAGMEGKQWAHARQDRDKTKEMLKLEEKRALDPQHDAKLLHGAMQNTTSKPTATEKQVFSYDPAGGLRIREGRAGRGRVPESDSSSGSDSS